MTNQETFDTIVKAVIAQGRPSADIYNGDVVRCLYRGANGAKCAAGHVIPDDKYVAAMEGGPAHGARVAHVLLHAGHDPKIVSALQVAHDSAARRAVQVAHDSAARRTVFGMAFDDARFVVVFKELARDVAADHDYNLSAEAAA